MDWLKAKDTVMVSPEVEARPAIDKGAAIGNTKIKPVKPDVGFIDTVGIDHKASPVLDVVNELGVTAMHVETGV